MAGNICDCCDREGVAGVLSSALGPISFAYCKECAEKNAEPEFMFRATYEMIGEDVADHVKRCTTFHEGRYYSWEEWVHETYAGI